jgi:uncharacterized membrane protein YcaP (DUF421 family)
VRVIFGYVWVLILVRISGRRTIRQADVTSFVLIIVAGDMFDDLLWAEVSVAQFVLGIGALLLAHLSAALVRTRASERIWRRTAPGR